MKLLCQKNINDSKVRQAILFLSLFLALVLSSAVKEETLFVNSAAILPLVDLGEIQTGAPVAAWGNAATGLALAPDEQSLYVGYINNSHSVDQYALPISASPITSINHAPYYGGGDIYGGNGGNHYPVALATDAAGNVYVANKDAGGETIPDIVDRFNSTLGGNTNVITYPDATEPIGIAVTGTDLYVVLRDTTLLERRTTAGVSVNSVTLAFTPYGVEVDPVGNIWVVGSGGNIAIYDPSLTPVNTLILAGVGNLADVAFYDQTAYLTERYGSRIFVVDLTPTLIETWDYDPGGGDARGFYGIDITSAGLIYLSGHWVFTPDNLDHLYTIQLVVPATSDPTARPDNDRGGTDGAFSLPSTGFAPDRMTTLDVQPVELTYASTDIALNIAQLGIIQNIVGVPQRVDGWNVNWLGNGIGYLSGTAFPTWAGNTVLTGHVWNADGSEGIFYGLDQLQYGDQFTIEAWDLTYTYEVRDSEQVYAHNLSVLDHSDYDIVTLLTCEGFSEWSSEYRYRRVVTAVLLDVK